MPPPDDIVPDVPLPKGAIPSVAAKEASEEERQYDKGQWKRRSAFQWSDISAKIVVKWLVLSACAVLVYVRIHHYALPPDWHYASIETLEALDCLIFGSIIGGVVTKRFLSD